MRKIICFLAMLILPILSFGNDDGRALFARGNAFYAKAKYTDALTAYQKMIDEGYQSAAIYFNMGNASYKNGDIPSALLYYEKAHKLAPGDEDINFNIRFVNLKTNDRIDEAPEFFIAKWWRSFILNFSIHTLALASIIAVALASALLIIYFFANSVNLKKYAFYTSLSLFFLSVMIMFIAGRQSAYFDSHHQAIIFSASVTVKSGPVVQSGNLFVLHEGTKVNVLTGTNGWIKIRLANGTEGWIKKTDVKEI